MMKSQIDRWIMILAFLLFALGSPVVKFLVQRGGELGISHPGSISFCNVLFVGNLCASALLLLYFKPGHLWREIKRTKHVGYLAISLLFATIAPAILFTALKTTSVTNLVLLSRFEVIVYAILAFYFLGINYETRQIYGFIFMGIGILSLVLVTNTFRVVTGDWLVLFASVLFSIDTMISKTVLTDMKPEVLTFLRTFTSSILFFFIGLKMFGTKHFTDAFQGELWEIMMVYSLVLVVLANLLYYYALPKCSIGYLTNLALLSPIMSIGFAFLLLEERPGLTHLSAGIIIFLGFAISRLSGKANPTNFAEAGFLGAQTQTNRQ